MTKTGFYEKIKKLFGGIMKCILRIHVYGSENEVSDGGIIIAANHLSLADPIALIIAMRRRMRILGKKELFKIPVVSQFIRAMGAYSVDRGHGDVAAVKKTVSLLRDGEAVCMFPQGTRCKGVEPEETEVKNGIGMMVVRAGVPVQPVYIKIKNNRFRFFRRIDVIIGEKMEFDIPEHVENKQELYAQISKEIFERICILKEQNR